MKSRKSEEVVSTLGEFVLPTRLERFNNVLAHRTRRLTIVLEWVKNYHNISAVLRSADAFGLTTVHLVGERFEYSRGIARGSERWLELIRHETAVDAVQKLTESGFEIVTLRPPSLDPTENSKFVPITALPFERPLALVFGNELAGVSDEFERAAKHTAYIPMYGFVESFNISVAAAICLFCSTIAPVECARRVQTLTEPEQQELLAKWLSADVQGAELILEEVAMRSGDPTERC